MVFTFGLLGSVYAQGKRAGEGTGSRQLPRQGAQHFRAGRIYPEQDGKLILRLTNFKTSNGPDVHVILVAAKDADDDANFLKSSTERVELGNLKGNEGDQNYEIPSGT